MTVKWRWSEREPGHFEVQCDHMTARWDGFGIDPEDPFLWATLPLHETTGWVIVQREPLTVTPSIHLVNCGCHGFITDGKWVPA